MPKLVITGSAGAREVFLSSGAILGRTADSAIALDAAEVSRQHCRFTEEKGSWFVEDLGSSNGTTVNGRKVTKFELQDGDEIAIGGIQLRFLDVEAPAGDLELEGQGGWGDDEISLERRVFLVMPDGAVLDIPPGRVTVGRNARHAIRIKDASVSGDHAVLVREDEHVTVQDSGSSNGTFVQGERVKERMLKAGDALRFGTIATTFGVGDPKDFQPAAAVVTAEASELAEDEWAADRLDLDSVPAKGERIWNLLALVAVLLLGAGAWFAIDLQAGSRASGPKALVKGSNLLPDLAWSFELPPGGEEAELAVLWRRAADAEGLEVAVLEGGSASGGSHLELLAREDLGRPLRAFAVLQEKAIGIPVAEGQAYDISVQVAEAGAAPLIAIQWLGPDAEISTERVLLSREILPGEPRRSDDWSELSGQVIAPTGVVEARVGVGILGVGSALFDDLRFARAEAPRPESAASSAGFLAALDGAGRLRLSRFQNLVIDGLGLRWMADGEAPSGQESRLAARPAETGFAGRDRRGSAGLSAAVRAAPKGFHYVLAGELLASAGGLVLPLGRDGDQVSPVIILDRRGEDEVATRHTASFQAQRGSALIVGPRTARARLEFLNSAGERMAFTADWTAEGVAPTVTLTGLSLGGGVTVAVQIDFSAETEQARLLLDAARSAEREGRRGAAAKLAQELLARYPFEEATAAAAGDLDRAIAEAAVLEFGRSEARVEAAKFYRTLASADGLLAHLDTQAKVFAGLPIAERFTGLRDDLSRAVAEFLAPVEQASAATALRRAKAYLAAERRQMARLFLQVLLARHPGTPEAAEAKDLLAGLEAGAKENG